MAPYKQVPSLIHSSGQILANTVFVVSKKFLCDGTNFDSFTEYIETLSLQLSNFLGRNNPNIAPLWLDIAEKLCKLYIKKVSSWSSDDEDEFLGPHNKDGRELKTKFVIDSLVRKAAHFHMERFILGTWSKKVETSFLNYIWNATDLHCLDLSYDSFLDKKIFPNNLLNRLPFLTNLTDFTADFFSNELIDILCKNCKSLESLKLGSSEESCTNESIYSLASLKKLQNVDGNCFMTEENLITLLLNSQSDNLQDITSNSDCSVESIDINYFLRQLVKDVVPFRTFNLRRICCAELKSHLLKLIPRYFPSLESICFINPVHNLPALSILKCLKNLKTIHLHSLGIGHSWEELWSLQTPLLTKLSVVYFYDDEDDYLTIEPDTLLEFGLNCPNLQSIELNQCSVSSHFKTTYFSKNIFQNLKFFELETGGPLSGVEIILSLAPNIEEIKISSSSKPTDEFFDCIYQSNPLSELKKLCCDLSEVSTEMLKFLIRRCPKIICLRNFGKARNANEHSELKKFISENNYDVSL